MNKKQIRRASLWLVLSAGVLAGCRTSSPDPPSATTITVSRTGPETFRSALTVLKAMHFRIAKADSEAGFIQTHPLSGAQWFEVWRRDNASGSAFAEANLHSLRRTVTLLVREEDGQVYLDCRVQCQRLSVPSRQVTSSSQLYHVLTDSEAMLQRLEFTEQQQQTMEWIDGDDDPALQNRILRNIERQLRST